MKPYQQVMEAARTGRVLKRHDIQASVQLAREGTETSTSADASRQVSKEHANSLVGELDTEPVLRVFRKRSRRLAAKRVNEYRRHFWKKPQSGR